MPVVEAEGLSKTYRAGWRRKPVVALDDFSVSVAAGDVFGLLGPNGAGKTTFIKLMLGAAFPTGGSVHLFGLTAGDPASRQRVGYLPEQNRFPGHMTATEVLDCYGRLASLDRATRRRRSEELLHRVGLADRAHSRVKTYSKGMMQRLGLAQVLMNDPDLVVLDEPSDGVDPIGRREIRDLVRELAAEGKSIFLNSHILSEVEQVCSRVVILDRGRVLAEGTVGELTSVRGAWLIRCSEVDPGLAAALGLDLDPGRAGDAEPSRPGTIKGPAGSVAPTGAPGDRLQTWRLFADHRAGLRPVLVGLLEAGVEIESVVPVRRSLEDSFVSLLETPHD